MAAQTKTAKIKLSVSCKRDEKKAEMRVAFRACYENIVSFKVPPTRTALYAVHNAQAGLAAVGKGLCSGRSKANAKAEQDHRISL